MWYREENKYYIIEVIGQDNKPIDGLRCYTEKNTYNSIVNFHNMYPKNTYITNKLLNSFSQKYKTKLLQICIKIENINILNWFVHSNKLI